MIDHFNLAAPVKELAGLNGFDQKLADGGQRNIVQKSILPEINLGPDIIRAVI